MSRIRDQFIASVAVLKNRPKLLKECIEAAGKWKKTGDLTAEEYDMIIALANKCDLPRLKLFSETR